MAVVRPPRLVKTPSKIRNEASARPPIQRRRQPSPGRRDSAAAPPDDFHAPLEPAAVHAIIAGIMLAMFLSALEQTIIAPALPTIGFRLGDIEQA